MSKLNEEILDTLLAAKFWASEYGTVVALDSPGADRLHREQVDRLDRVMNYFLAKRTVEEFRREL